MNDKTPKVEKKTRIRLSENQVFAVIRQTCKDRGYDDFETAGFENHFAENLHIALNQ